MALLHEALYGSGTLAHINFSAYVEDLCAQLLRAHGPVAARVQVDVRVAGVGLPLEQSVPCGLIINELVSNALKHAFPGHRPGRVLVEASLIEPTMLRLRVSDNGVGLPGGFEPLKTGTLGLQLVATLAKQLRGKLAVEESSAVGAAFTVAFPIPELASEPEP